MPPCPAGQGSTPLRGQLGRIIPVPRKGQLDCQATPPRTTTLRATALQATALQATGGSAPARLTSRRPWRCAAKPRSISSTGMAWIWAAGSGMRSTRVNPGSGSQSPGTSHVEGQWVRLAALSFHRLSRIARWAGSYRSRWGRSTESQGNCGRPHVPDSATRAAFARFAAADPGAAQPETWRSASSRHEAPRWLMHGNGPGDRLTKR